MQKHGAEFKFVVGLGNPGRRYHRTRHNVGFMVLKELRRRWEFGRAKRKFHARCWAGKIGPQKVMLVAPQTYMNRSGRTVAEITAFYKADAAAVLVLMDDVALPTGRLRARASGSAGGHKGMDSILEILGTNQLARVRIGVGAPPEGMDSADYVLRDFQDHEKPAMSDTIKQAADAAEDWTAKDITYVMDHYNYDANSVSEPQRDGKDL